LIRFFSKLRNEILTGHKTQRYLLYAVGEVLLVIVGILIALQIDNWNDERIDRKEIREYALNLSSAIDRDLEMLAPVEMQIWASIRQSEVLAEYLRDRDLEQIDNTELFL
jgi:sensor domain CHASE-containing protein